MDHCTVSPSDVSSWAGLPLIQDGVPEGSVNPLIDLSVLPAFLGVILVFLAPPGPDMAYMLAVGLQGGRLAAVRAILGIGTGMAVYAAAVVLGLGSLAAAYPAALTVVKLAGAVYLLWLAITTFRHARTTHPAENNHGTGRWFRRGLVVSLTNPKVILFFMAVLPRFLGNAENTTAQLALLGAVNVATEVILYGAIGVCAGALSGRLTAHPHAPVILNYVASAVYVILAFVIGIDALTSLRAS